MPTPISPSKMNPSDLIRTATVGLRTRRMRMALSALGIAIGIAALVGVLGLSESSKSDLLDTLDRLGTNLLTVEAGSGIGIGTGELPIEAAPMIARIGPVKDTVSISAIDASVYKNDLVPAGQTGGISVQAAGPDLLGVLAGDIAQGTWFSDATTRYPTVVLGSIAAERLALSSVEDQPQVWLGDQWFTVIGILHEFDLAPDLDRAAIISFTAADLYLDHDNVPTRILVRVDPDFVTDVVDVLALTANPENPDEIEIARPTDALEAKEAADDALTSLFLGLGAVGLLVGGVGIANVMVISVLERRSEIGLRRALGATRRHVAFQFLGESLLLAAIGGLGGVALGSGVVYAYASFKGWGVLIPTVALAGGIGAALVIGVIAGLYPAIRASKLSPTEALRTA